jgi:ATP-dependent helicase Lhr and Lhr-like helicase
VVAPARADADVQLDDVRSLPNAARVIARLHGGEKRLVFCDSRTQVEALATELRVLGVSTFVSHSSLSRDERLRAEAAFAQGNDCVIVATSTLELGIDVGDLDRVIQIDAPFTVAAFLQRLGRSGRRQGTRRNCLFLATTDDALLRAAAILHLWEEGFVEAVQPPPLPYHVLAQQVLALVLQEGGSTAPDVDLWLGAWCSAAGIPPTGVHELLAYMLKEELLFDDQGILSVGGEGEACYGQKNFLEIFSVFLSPPLVQVYHGRNELGQVHENSFRRSDEGPTLLSLGGRGWRVTYVDRAARRAFVEPAEGAGRSRWLGSGQPMHFQLCQAVASVLARTELPPCLSRRGREALTTLRDEFYWVSEDTTEMIVDPERSGTRWWTFAGDRYNAAAAAALVADGLHATYDSFSVRINGGDVRDLPDILAHISDRIQESPGSAAREEMLEQFKFIDCIPEPFRKRMLEVRFSAAKEAEAIARRGVRSRHLS